MLAQPARDRAGWLGRSVTGLRTPLPFSEPARIVEISNSFPKVGLDNMPSNVVQYLDFKEHAPAFAHLALWQLGESTLGDEGAPVRVSLVRTTTDMFEVLRIQPLVGRFFTAANHVPKADRVVVLTQSYWESNYQPGARRVGRTVRLDGGLGAVHRRHRRRELSPGATRRRHRPDECSARRMSGFKDSIRSDHGQKDQQT